MAQDTKDRLFTIALIILFVSFYVAAQGFREVLGEHQLWLVSDLCLVIICGLLFYVFARGSEPELKISQIGARIGGGAAIGLVVIYFVTVVIIPSQFPTKIKLYSLEKIKRPFLVENNNSKIENFPTKDYSQLVVLFKESDIGVISIVSLDDGSRTSYEVSLQSSDLKKIDN